MTQSTKDRSADYQPPGTRPNMRMETSRRNEGQYVGRLLSHHEYVSSRLLGDADKFPTGSLMQGITLGTNQLGKLKGTATKLSIL
jgi:hypothetical protein